MPHRFSRLPLGPARGAATLALLAAACLAGCRAAPPDSIYGLPALREFDEGFLLLTIDDAKRLGYTPVWATDLNLDRRQRVNRVAVLDDLVVVSQDPAPVATAVQLNNGVVRWSGRIGQDIAVLSSGMRRGEAIWFVVDTSELQAFDVDTGRLVGRQPLDEPAASEPVMIGDRVLYGSLQGRAIAHDLNLGFAAWKYALVTAIPGRPAVVGDQAFFADERGTYAKFLVGEGDLLWRGRAFQGVVASPVMTRTAVYMPSRDGTLYALDRASGDDLWVYRTATPLTAPAAVLAGNVYLPIPRGDTVVLDQRTGDELWRAAPGTTPAFLVGGDLLATRGSTLLRLDPDTGREIVAVDAAEPVRAVETPGGMLIIADGGRILYLERRG